jgi:hypothetical protein
MPMPRVEGFKKAPILRLKLQKKKFSKIVGGQGVAQFAQR